LPSNPERLGEIDESFSKFVLKLAKSGYPPAAKFFFVGLNSVLEYGYLECPNQQLITNLGLRSLALQLDRFIPVEPDDEDRVVH